MTEPRALTETLVRFARTLTAGYDVSDVLHDLTGMVTGALGITGAGVSLRYDHDLKFVTADDESVVALERLQEQLRQGPCIDAVATGEPILVSRIDAVADRWPDYSRRAAELGLRAVAAVPMRNASRIGSLDLFDRWEHDWTGLEVSTAQVFADVATAYVLNASQLERERRTVEQLQHALDSRVVIEQAKGIIAGERGVTLDAAFALLRKHANDRNTTLRSVADAVVRLGLRP